MAAADVLSLVTLLSNGQADMTVVPSLMVEIIDQWGDGPTILTAATLVTINAATEFNVPAQVRRIMQLIWDDRELGRLTLRELESLDPEWRQRKGKPSSFTDQAETAKTLAFYPSPFIASNPDLGGGEPLGANYPTYSAVLINTEGRTDVMPYLELQLALLIVEREFSRESDHRNAAFAQIAGDFGRLLLGMVVP